MTRSQGREGPGPGNEIRTGDNEPTDEELEEAEVEEVDDEDEPTEGDLAEVTEEDDDEPTDDGDGTQDPPSDTYVDAPR